MSEYWITFFGFSIVMLLISGGLLVFLRKTTHKHPR